MADPEPGGPAENSALRASHSDRDQVVEVLRLAAGDGRLDPEELDERLERALTARTYDELAVLTADLPAAGASAALAPMAPGALASATAPKDVLRIQCTSGSARREGRWVVPKRLDVKVTSGTVTLDFTDAVLSAPSVRIDAEVGSGSLTLITRPGIDVDVDEVAVRSGSVRVRAPWGHDIPVVLRVEIAGTCRSGSITARPPRRSFWQWLRRAPRRYAIAA